MSKKSDIEALLPQTQCQRCEYSGCEPYAEAVANKEAPINKCAPGGKWVLEKIAQLDGRAPTQEEVNGLEPERMWKAYIDPQRCIGCYKCVDVCPTSAIVGRSKSLHGVLEDLCTGCGLCLPTCPMDCIEQHESEESLVDRWNRKDQFKQAYQQQQRRQLLKKEQLEKIHLQQRKKKSTREETVADRQQLFERLALEE